MKTFFINPPSPFKYPVIRDVYRSGRSSKEGMVWCQTQLAQLAALVDKKDHPRIIDCVAENIDYIKLRKIFLKEKPDSVVFEVIPATYSNDMYVKTLADEIGAESTAVGPHIISIAEQIETMKWEDMPSPRYDLLPLKKYIMPFLGRYVFVPVSRGCPFKCIFCRERIAFKGKFEARPIDKIVEDVKLLKQYKIQTYLFHAGNFTTDKRWVYRFCDEIGKLNIRWACNTHLKTIDKPMARTMKDAGCCMIAPGIESGDPDILENIRKDITLRDIYDKVNILHNVGLEVWGYFIFGLPGETKMTMARTTQLACNLPLDIAHFGIATPYYGTEFYKLAREKGWLKATRWEDYDQNTSVCIEYNHLKTEDIKRGIRHAYKKFYLRPKQIKKIIKAGFATDIGVLIRIVKGLL